MLFYKSHVAYIRNCSCYYSCMVLFQYGNNALHEAAWNGHADVTKLLLKSSCFVDSINKNGCTPLHLAAQNGQAKVVQVLLKFKADASILNQVHIYSYSIYNI